MDAWSECMSQWGGLILYFEAPDEYARVLHIKYVTPKDTFVLWPDLTVMEASQLPPHFDSSKAIGLDCLQPDHVLHPNSTCDVTFASPSSPTRPPEERARAAWATWNFSIRLRTPQNIERSYSAYLMPRSNLVVRPKVWPPKPPIHMSGAYSTGRSGPSEGGLQCEHSDAGFYFLQATEPFFHLDLFPWGGLATKDQCRIGRAFVQEPGDVICVSAKLTGTFGAYGDHYCNIAVVGTEIKFEFDPPDPTPRTFVEGQPQDPPTWRPKSFQLRP